jgi:hypothetical protein
MTSTLTPTCPFCGLRFDSRPLLELHVREDHAHLDRPAEAARGGPDSRTSGPRPNGPAAHGQSVAPSRAQEPVTMRNARRPGQPRTGRTAGVLRRVAGAFRRANAELLLAWEAMLRPAGAPRPPRPAGPPAERDAQSTAAKGRADRAA